MDSNCEDSSSNGSEDAPRKCLKCGRRISAIRLDAHEDCIKCRGFDCTVEQRCATCETWSVDSMHAYTKYRKILANKREYKKRQAAKVSQLKRPSSAASAASESVSAVSAPPPLPSLAWVSLSLTNCNLF